MMKINKTIAISVALFGLLAGGLGAAIWLSQQPLSATAAPPAQVDTPCLDDEEHEQEAEDESDEAEECDDDDPDEADDVDEMSDVEDDDEAEHEDEHEASLSPNQVHITANEARAAAEAAYPGAKAIEVELEKEHGTMAYEVELDNGLEVMVDPIDGSILSTDAD